MKTTVSLLILVSLIFSGSLSLGQEKVKQDDGINQKYWSLLKVRHFSKGIAKANSIFKNFSYATILFNDDFIKLNVFANTVNCLALNCPEKPESKLINLPVVKKIVDGCYDVHIAEASGSGIIAVRQALIVERFASERCDAKLDTRQGKAQYLIKGLSSETNTVETLGIMFDLSEVVEIVEQEPGPMPYPTSLEK